MMNSIHSPADSLVLSSSFHSINSLSPPSTPGCKRSYYPTEPLSPMPEFLSSNGSLLSADHLLVALEDFMSKEQQVKRRELMAQRPLPSFVLLPRASSPRATTEDDGVTPLPHSQETSPVAPPAKRRIAYTSSLPRLPSLSEHNNVVSSLADEFERESDQQRQGKMGLVGDDKKNTKLPAFQRTGMQRKEENQGKRNSLVARCA